MKGVPRGGELAGATDTAASPDGGVAVRRIVRRVAKHLLVPERAKRTSGRVRGITLDHGLA